MNAGEHRNTSAVGLFGKGIVNIMASQTGLDVTHRNFGVIGRERGSEGSCCITLYEHHVGLETPTGIFDRIKYADGKRVERLVGTHHVKVEVGLDLEKLESVVQHCPMLSGMYYRSVELI